MLAINTWKWKIEKGKIKIASKAYGAYKYF